MSYLRLSPGCRLVEGAHNMCILDCLGGTVNSLRDAESGFMRQALGPRPVEDLLAALSPGKRGRLEEFLGQLIERQLGARYSRPYHVLPVERGIGPGSLSFLEPTRLDVLFLELVQDCGLDCLFCRPPDVFGRGTGCGRYGEDGRVLLSTSRRRELLSEAARLGAQELHLTGGDALLSGDCLDVAAEALELGFRSVTVWTTGLGPLPSALTRDSRIRFAFQAYSYRPEVHDQVAGRAGAHADLARCLEALRAARAKALVNLIVTRFDEDHWSESQAYYQTFTDLPVRVMPLYPTGDGDFSPTHGCENLFTARRWFRTPDAYLLARADEFHTCFRGKLAITADGRILPCPSGRTWVMGEAVSESLWAVLAAGRHKPYWELPKSRIGKCSRCEFRLVCFDCRVIQGRGRSLEEASFCDYDPESGRWIKLVS